MVARFAWGALAVLAACGSGGGNGAGNGAGAGGASGSAGAASGRDTVALSDDCERLFEKLKPIVEKAAKERGRSVTSEDKKQYLEECRAAERAGRGTAEERAIQQCVLAASDDAAVATCMEPVWGSRPGRRVKKSEAEHQLTKIGTAAKTYFAAAAAFPVGSVPLTPDTPCCGLPDNKCAPLPASEWSASPLWAALDFQVEEPHFFRYSVESDGKTLVAKAVGDLDCDGTAITYTLEVTTRSGSPAETLTLPSAAD